MAERVFAHALCAAMDRGNQCLSICGVTTLYEWSAQNLELDNKRLELENERLKAVASSPPKRSPARALRLDALTESPDLSLVLESRLAAQEADLHAELHKRCGGQGGLQSVECGAAAGIM